MMCHRSPLVHRLKCLPKGRCCKVSETDSGNREANVDMLRTSQSCIFQALCSVAAESMASRHVSGENKARTRPKISALVDEGSYPSRCAAMATPLWRTLTMPYVCSSCVSGHVRSDRPGHQSAAVASPNYGIVGCVDEPSEKASGLSEMLTWPAS